MSAKRAKDEENDEIKDDESTGVAVEEGGEEGGEEEATPLDLKVDIKSPSACERHVTVTIPRDDIDRYFDNAFGELMPTAAVPGFRIGRAPRKLVEHRFQRRSHRPGEELAADGQPGADQRGASGSRRSASRTSIWKRSRCPTTGR